jgi:ABC-type multidrug transport system fused ATPase/permease subunit
VIQKQLYDIQSCVIWYESLSMGFLFLSTSCSIMMIIQYGQNNSILSNRITSGQLTSFTTYSFLLGLGTSSFVKSLSEIYNTNRTNIEHLSPLLLKYYSMQKSKLNTNNTNCTSSSSLLQLESNQNNLNNIHDPVDGILYDDDHYDIQSISMSHVSFTYDRHYSYHTKDSNNSNDTDRHHQSLLLSDISITIRRGHVIGILGKNGCGKTTISKLLCGLHQPTSGTITVSLLSTSSNSRHDRDSNSAINSIAETTNTMSSSSTLTPTTTPSETACNSFLTKDIDLNDLLQFHRKQQKQQQQQEQIKYQEIDTHNQWKTTTKGSRRQRPIVLMIPQDIVLFHQMSIYDNVRYGYNGDGDASDTNMTASIVEQDVITALQKANCYDAILQQFPLHGIHTVVGHHHHNQDDDNTKSSSKNVTAKERGKNDVLDSNHNSRRKHESNIELSGGMKQRILLARIILQQPYFVIMDEPLNHMDQFGIQAVYDTIKQCRMNHIGLLLITHHIPTLLHANFDCIYLVGEMQQHRSKEQYQITAKDDGGDDDGFYSNLNTIIESGTLEELLYDNQNEESGSGEILHPQQPPPQELSILPTNANHHHRIPRKNSYLCEIMPSLLDLRRKS